MRFQNNMMNSDNWLNLGGTTSHGMDTRIL
jgi:hypothetical protein